MAEWREWNPSNEPGTCLWCGHKLRQGKGTFVDDPTAPSGRRFDGDALMAKLGGYADGFFCGLRCGYLFGVEFAGFGRRLNPKPRPLESATKP